jgi:hypothetical protein
VLFLSKDIKHEASWVLYNQGLLHIYVSRTMRHCLDGSRAKSLRQVGTSIHKSSKKVLMWATAACYRFITILTPDE